MPIIPDLTLFYPGCGRFQPSDLAGLVGLWVGARALGSVSHNRLPNLNHKPNPNVILTTILPLHLP